MLQGTGGAVTGGRLVVDCLRAQGVDRVFCVPGESYLPVLDSLADGGVDTVVCRHEGAAAMMAEADGKMTGRPGVALVTRGPGATNAASGVHVAKQDSTPMVLLVGQIGRAMRGREAFQELDYRQTFGDLAKWVEQIDDAARIPEIISHAWHVAMAGRPGPVVLALPEDMLRDAAAVPPGPRVRVAAPAPDAGALRDVAAALAGAQRPLAVLGGSRWDAGAVAAAQDFAAAQAMPLAVSFRRQGLCDAHHPAYAGDVGLGINPALLRRIEEADLLLLLGCRFSENPSQDFGLLGIPDPGKTLIHVHPGAEELGRIYAPTVAVNATPGAFLEAARALPPRLDDRRVAAAHADYLAWSAPPAPDPAREGVDMAQVIAALNTRLPDDAIVTNGAGNYAIWLHRFFRYRGWGAQLAPVSGSMGYGLPAAVAAKLRHPDRPVVCLAGDGCFQMTGQELATAAQAGAAVVVLICDNAMYGTIRMHQAKRFPGRPWGTTLRNPDFAALARAHGCHAATVTRDADIVAALDAALEAATDAPAVVHLRTDSDAITPALSLAAMEPG